MKLVFGSFCFLDLIDLLSWYKSQFGQRDKHNLLKLKALLWINHLLVEAKILWQEFKQFADETKMLGFKNRDESDYLKQMKDIGAQEQLQKLKPLCSGGL